MITIKSQSEIEIMAEAGKILARIMKELEKNVRIGISTEELDRLAESLIFSAGGRCSFKGYNVPDDSAPKKCYPSCLCTSINEEIVHAVPSQRKLKDGDIISLDLGIFWKGFHADMAKTFPVGKISPIAQKLIDVTEKSLQIGIKEIKPGNKISDIGFAIQKYVEKEGFSVIKELCGHGIGKDLHEDPEILNYSKRGLGIELKEGMVLCLEPMVTIGDWHIKKSKDDFGWKTQDDSLSAHFEHTIAVTKDGYSVLTES